MSLLLGSQCLHGFDGSGAACRNDGSREREQEYGDRGQHDYGWVKRVDLKEHGAHEVGGKKSCDRTKAATGERKFCAGGENQVHDTGTLRPERKPYGHLLGAQRGREGYSARRGRRPPKESHREHRQPSVESPARG